MVHGAGDGRDGEKVPICGRNRRPEPAGWRVREIGLRRSNGLKTQPTYGVAAISPSIGLQYGENGGRRKGATEARTNKQMGNRFGGVLWERRAKLAGLANRRCVRVVTYQRCPTCAVLAMHESRQRSAWRIFRALASSRPRINRPGLVCHGRGFRCEGNFARGRGRAVRSGKRLSRQQLVVGLYLLETPASVFCPRCSDWRPA